MSLNLHMNKLRSGQIFTKFGKHMWFDKTKPKVNNNFFFLSGVQKGRDQKVNFTKNTTFLQIRLRTTKIGQWDSQTMLHRLSVVIRVKCHRKVIIEVIEVYKENPKQCLIFIEFIAICVH